MPSPNSRAAIILPLLVVLAAACGPAAGAATAEQATDAANQFLSNENPRLNLAEAEIETIDMGDRWRLSYGFSHGGTGGTTIIVVNKRSGEVVHRERSQ